MKIESCTIGFIHPFRLWPLAYGSRWQDCKSIGLDFLFIRFELSVSGLKNINENIPF